ALVAASYASACADKVDGLVLIEGFAPVEEAADLSVQRIAQGIRSRRRLHQKNKAKGYADFEAGLKHKAEHNQLTALQAKPLVERGLAYENERWQWRYDPKLKADSLYRMTPEQAQQIIQSIRCPVLGILGAQGIYAQNEQTKQKLDKYLKSYQHLERVTLDGGHHCHLQNPNYISQLLLEFINKVSDKS
ncbi:MAG: alpha/beta fold hydrolase, partial [Vibrio sp.]